jgi:polysaccharide export outer membrane protein
MTVVNAVALAGGFTYRAAKKEVHIVRSEDKARVPQPASQQAPVFPGDVIEVSERFF